MLPDLQEKVKMKEKKLAGTTIFLLEVILSKLLFKMEA